MARRFRARLQGGSAVRSARSHSAFARHHVNDIAQGAAHSVTNNALSITPSVKEYADRLLSQYAWWLRIVLHNTMGLLFFCIAQYTLSGVRA